MKIYAPANGTTFRLWVICNGEMETRINTMFLCAAARKHTRAF